MAWQRGHFWIAIAGAVLCVLRARFFLLDVLRFGTAMVGTEKDKGRDDSGLAFAQLPQRFPAGIRRGGRAVARTEVQLGPTRWT